MIASITIPASAWRAAGGKGNKEGRLLTQVAVNGRYFHVEAIEVVVRVRDGQVAADPELEATLAPAFEAFGGDGPLQTLTIGGRDYVVFIYPPS